MPALIPERPGSARESRGPGVQDMGPSSKTFQPRGSALPFARSLRFSGRSRDSVSKKPAETTLFRLRSGQERTRELRLKTCGRKWCEAAFVMRSVFYYHSREGRLQTGKLSPGSSPQVEKVFCICSLSPCL